MPAWLAWHVASVLVKTGRMVPASKWVDEAKEAASEASWDAFAPG